ncbi:MAG: CRISPR-associated endonuclease Cas1 [Lentisphaerae bacterium]|nr:CRISPR-associated endonuclease Cas1 [Lentisphaerota bacterium]
MPTLYINGSDVEARLDDRRVSLAHFNYSKDDIELSTVPIFDIERVVLIGYPKVSMQLLHHFIYQKIPVYFLSPHGRWVSSMLPNVDGNALRRLRQYDAACDQEMSLMAAKQVIYAKIRNMRRVLQRLAANRSQSQEDEQRDACNSLQDLALQVRDADSPDSVRGYEGMATAIYFRRLAVFFPPELPFVSRNRRPPRDAANAILSWTYSIVLAEIEAEVRCAALDPCIGFLHEISHGRPSLALDLLEPLRAPLADLLALNLINHKLLRQEHFENNPEDGGVYLKNTSLKLFFSEYEQYMERFFAATKGGNRVTFRRIIKNMVHAVCNMIETKQEPQFFLMP